MEEFKSPLHNEPQSRESAEEGPTEPTMDQLLTKVQDKIQALGYNAEDFFSQERTKKLLKAFALSTALTMSNSAEAVNDNDVDSYNAFMGETPSQTTPSWQKPKILQKVDAVLGGGVQAVGDAVDSTLTPGAVAGAAAGTMGGPFGIVTSGVATEMVDTLQEKANAEHDHQFMQDLTDALTHRGGEVTHRNTETGAVYTLRPATPEEVQDHHDLLAEVEETETTTDVSDKSAESTQQPGNNMIRHAIGLSGVAASVVMNKGNPTNIAIDLATDRAIKEAKKRTPRPWEMGSEEVIDLLEKTSGNPFVHDGQYFILEHSSDLPVPDSYGDFVGDN